MARRLRGAAARRCRAAAELLAPSEWPGDDDLAGRRRARRTTIWMRTSRRPAAARADAAAGGSPRLRAGPGSMPRGAEHADRDRFGVAAQPVGDCQAPSVATAEHRAAEREQLDDPAGAPDARIGAHPEAAAAPAQHDPAQVGAAAGQPHPDVGDVEPARRGAGGRQREGVAARDAAAQDAAARIRRPRASRSSENVNGRSRRRETLTPRPPPRWPQAEALEAGRADRTRAPAWVVPRGSDGARRGSPPAGPNHGSRRSGAYALRPVGVAERPPRPPCTPGPALRARAGSPSRCSWGPRTARPSRTR